LAVLYYSMFIRKVSKYNGRTSKKYEYLHLIESVRTEQGPRQKLVLNLGVLEMDESQYSALARRIQDILTGEESFLSLPESVEKIARQSAAKIFRKQASDHENQQTREYGLVDIESMEAEQARSIGPEYVCHTVWNELNLNEFFLSHGVKKESLPVLEALIAGRLIDAGSERRLQAWASMESGLYELAGEPLQGSLNSFYRGTDRIFGLKDELERHLARREKDLFLLKERYCFFDLTNTYFEGACRLNGKAAYGRSKEKRSDCKLVTLGMVVDEEGFAKSSNLYAGNINEPKTLEGMIQDMEKKTCGEGKEKTVVIDAGVAKAENIGWLKEHGYGYIVVNRGNAPFPYDFEGMQVVRSEPARGVEIEIKRYVQDEEVYVLCRSRKKEIKEKSMRGRMETLFLERLIYYKEGLKKERRTKTYPKMVEMIGRLKEKYSKVAKLYEIEVVPEDVVGQDLKTVKVKDIVWKKNKHYEVEEEREGSYILRSSRTDLSDKEIWDIYIMLRRIEYSFLCLKSHLGLRPNFHQLEDRMDAHMFISVVAYHLMHVIEHKLQQKKDPRTWETIKNALSTHQRVTISFNRKMTDGTVRKQLLRLSTRLEEVHADIYLKLGINGRPLPRKIMMKTE
jgi:transposase